LKSHAGLFLEKDASDVLDGGNPGSPPRRLVRVARSQASSYFKSLAAMVFFATASKGPWASSATGLKFLSKSYWSV
jgi:hypothetical protein